MTTETFQALARAIDPDMALSGERAFELVWDEESLSARVYLAPDDATVVTDVYLHDAAPFSGALRDTLHRLILTINGQAALRSDFVLGLDSRSYLVLTGLARLAGLEPDPFLASLAHWREQGVRCREAAMAVGMQGADLGFEVADAEVDVEEAAQ